MDNKTTSKTKPNEIFKTESEYLNKLKDKRSSGSDSKYRNFLPGEIGNYEDENLLSLFKNTQSNESKHSKFSNKLKRSSMVATGYTTPETEMNVNSNILKTLTHSQKDSFSNKEHGNSQYTVPRYKYKTNKK